MTIPSVILKMLRVIFQDLQYSVWHSEEDRIEEEPFVFPQCILMKLFIQFYIHKNSVMSLGRPCVESSIS